MKNIISLFVGLILSFNATSQIILEYEYPENRVMQLATIEGEDTKYIGVDTMNNRIHIYNTDHTLWKVINTNLPKGTRIRTHNNFYASKYLFNSDNMVEVVISYDLLVNGEYRTYMAIINEVGTYRNTVPGITDYHLITMQENGQSIWKLWCTTKTFSDGMGTSNYQFTQIYRLKGQWTGINNTAKISANKSSIYPNPMINYSTITYDLPSNVQYGNIQVYDMTGREVKQFNITNQYKDIKVSRDNLPSGQYIYTISANGKKLETNKFIIH